jgi:acyl carrier protein
MDKTTPLAGHRVPVGYQVEDTQVVLLDADGREVAPGAVGEIAIKSRYLVPGYWRQPELTRAAFQVDPTGGERRIYRTGDLGRMQPDGCLEHLGRQDFQVNIRGHRVEVAEIEMALQEHADIQEAAVQGHTDHANDPCLVAYVVPVRPPAPSVSTLRHRLRQKLPDYMVPAAFIVLEALPRTPNGKVDYRALPAPAAARRELDSAYAPPRTPLEAVLVQIWAEVLGGTSVGLYDHFFDLGGHSLLAVQILSRIRATLQVEVPLQRFFEAPTVATLAPLVVAHEATPGQSDKIAGILQRLDGMSAEEIRHTLQHKSLERDRR